VSARVVSCLCVSPSLRLCVKRLPSPDPGSTLTARNSVRVPLLEDAEDAPAEKKNFRSGSLSLLTAGSIGVRPRRHLNNSSASSSHS